MSKNKIKYLRIENQGYLLIIIFQIGDMTIRK